jgi:hypothetical protein
MTVVATTPRRPASHAFATPVVREIARPTAGAGSSAW